MKLLRSLLILLTLAALLVASLGVSVFAEEAPLTNAYDKSGSSRGLLKADGTTIMNNAYVTCAPIAVEPGDLLTFGPVPLALDFFLQVYDANGEIVDGDVQKEKLTVCEEGFSIYYNICSYEVPENAASVRLVVLASFANVFTVTRNRPFNAKDFYDYWQKTKPQYVKNYGQIFEEKTDSPLRGHSAIFFGDSICHAMDNDFYYNGWVGRLAEVNGMDAFNAAQSGASISTCRGENRVIAQMNKTERTDFEFVIMHGGVNDAWNQPPIGTLTEGFDGPFDPDTFAGGLEELFSAVKERYPNAIYGYVINFKLPLATQGTIADMSAHVEMIKAACDKWGVTYLDLYHDEDFCKNVLQVYTTTYIPDRIHPNSLGYDRIYPKIEAWLLTLLPEDSVPETTVPETTVPDTTAPETTVPETTVPETTEPKATIPDTTAPETSAPASGGCQTTLRVPFAIVGIGTLAAALFHKKKEQ